MINIIRLIRVLAFFSLALPALAQEASDNLSAFQIAADFNQLDLENLPVWDKDNYKQRFKEIRDKKFLTYQGEKRRIPWLYARDGCHTRSTLFIREAERLNYEKPKKVFIFGELEIKGSIIPRGSVKPWFHAAPIVQVNGEPMVLDPAVSFSRPLPLQTWAELITIGKTIFSICSPDTYMQTSSCNSPGPLDMKRFEEETQLFLRFETNIMRNLGLSFK